MSNTETLTRCAGCANDTVNARFCAECTTVAIDHGNTRAELSEAFDRVKNMDHWKGPIDATLTATIDEIKLILRAIEFYTATRGDIRFIEPETVTIQEPMLWKVQIRAKGYWAGPAC